MTRHEYFEEVASIVRCIERARADGVPIMWSCDAAPAKTFAEALELAVAWILSESAQPHPERLARTLAGTAKTVEDLHAAIAAHPRVVELLALAGQDPEPHRLEMLETAREIANRKALHTALHGATSPVDIGDLRHRELVAIQRHSAIVDVARPRALAICFLLGLPAPAGSDKWVLAGRGRPELVASR